MGMWDYKGWAHNHQMKMYCLEQVFYCFYTSILNEELASKLATKHGERILHVLCRIAH